VATIADFNGDNRADILWHSASGDLSVWLMNGTSVGSWASLGTIWTGWWIFRTGDFNGDGRTDILWFSWFFPPWYPYPVPVPGDVSIWLMDGTTISSYSVARNASGSMPQ
jgi:hypothetical protein